MTKSVQSLATKSSLWIWYGLLAYLPLHIFLSTWIGTNFGVLPAAKVAKDVVLLMGFLLALLANFLNKDSSWKMLLKDSLVKIILAYGLLNLVLVLVRPTDGDAELLGLVYNTRFLLFFLFVILLSKIIDQEQLRVRSTTIVLTVAVPVLLFGIFQYTLLPNNALTHIGYSRENGVLPAFFIDDKPDLERVMSTLRDPNSFGSYLLIIGALGLTLLFKKPKSIVSSHFYFPLILTLLTTMCLWFTFSRSAWLGFMLMTIVVGWLAHKRQTSHIVKRFAIPLFVGIVVVVGVLVTQRNSYFVQNIVFHADQSTVLEDPNQLRARFWRESLTNITNDPIGSGPGTAGLTSIRNDLQGVKLNENYYLQIASELGVLGLVLFLGIVIIVAKRLHSQAVSGDWLAIAVFASFVGLVITNFFVHIWSNEAVAYTWWGLATLLIITSSSQGVNSKFINNLKCVKGF